MSTDEQDRTAQREALAALEPLTFSPAGISVYRLGNNGTAAEHLHSWTTS